VFNVARPRIILLFFVWLYIIGDGKYSLTYTTVIHFFDGMLDTYNKINQVQPSRPVELLSHWKTLRTPAVGLSFRDFYRERLFNSSFLSIISVRDSSGLSLLPRKV
jgi:hypothetical protein